VINTSQTTNVLLITVFIYCEVNMMMMMMMD